MTVQLNHTIISAHDNHESAAFMAEILGLSVGAEVGPFVQVQLENNVTLDFMRRDEFSPEHYAFLVDDDTFDRALKLMEQKGLTTYAEPGHDKPGELNYECGGRGFYFDDLAGHTMELLTKD